VGGIVGGFCAAFFAFVAIGGALTLVIAEPYNVDVDCWPHYTVFGIVRTDCASPLADAAWYATAEAARYFAVLPTVALAQLVQVARTGSTFWLNDALAWGQYGLPVLIACAIGFFHLVGRRRAVAWVLLVLLAGQIAAGVAPHMTGDLVEPMD
jgi:hypothetical protein